MPQRRRHPGGAATRPGGRGPAGPGRTRSPRAGAARPTSATGAPAGGRRGSTKATGTGASKAAGKAVRPRLTGRAAVLVLVLAVLAVSYASSLRAYLDQRAQLDDLASTIGSREDEIATLEDERTRWQDPAFVRNQARERLGYVRPGETSYVATRDGVPIEGGGRLDEPGSGTEPAQQPWYDDLWDSVQVAGDPPRETTPPADRIDGRSAAE